MEAMIALGVLSMAIGKLWPVHTDAGVRDAEAFFNFGSFFILLGVFAFLYSLIRKPKKENLSPNEAEI